MRGGRAEQAEAELDEEAERERVHEHDAEPTEPAEGHMQQDTEGNHSEQPPGVLNGQAARPYGQKDRDEN